MKMNTKKSSSPQLVNQIGSDSRARGGKRMAKSNGTAVHVGSLGIQAQGFLHGQELRGKGLVDLNDVNVVHSQLVLLEQVLNSWHWTLKYC
jgi:hypothetical protein